MQHRAGLPHAYGLDRGNSAIEKARVSDDMTR